MKNTASDQEKKARRQRGLEVFTKMAGPDMAKQFDKSANSGKFGSAIAEFSIDNAFADYWSRPNLSMRDRSLVTISILATLGQLQGLRSHVRMGIGNGLTIAEIEEALLQISAYAGYPASVVATTAALEELRSLGLVTDVKSFAEEPGFAIDNK